MIPYLREGIGALTGAAVVSGLMHVHYEGLPIVRDIPFIEYIPIVGGLAEGKVETEREKAADAAREGYVLEADKIAAEAELAKIIKQRDASRRAADGYAILLAEWQAAYHQAVEQERIEDERYEQELAASGRTRKLDAADIDHLLRQSAARRAAAQRGR